MKQATSPTTRPTFEEPNPYAGVDYAKGTRVALGHPGERLTGTVVAVSGRGFYVVDVDELGSRPSLHHSELRELVDGSAR